MQWIIYVSFSQVNVSMLFRQSGHVFCECEKIFFMLTAVQNYKNCMSFSTILITDGLERTSIMLTSKNTRTYGSYSSTVIMFNMCVKHE